MERHDQIAVKERIFNILNENNQNNQNNQNINLTYQDNARGSKNNENESYKFEENTELVECSEINNLNLQLHSNQNFTFINQSIGINKISNQKRKGYFNPPLAALIITNKKAKLNHNSDRATEV